MEIWNPWHGCHKKSPGCAHCYMFRRDALVGRDSRKVEKTGDFDLPLRKNRAGDWKIPLGETVYACLTSDFFLEDADLWREQAWFFIRHRQDLRFVIITKRIERFGVGLPQDWGQGYGNVTVCVTCENQEMADERIPLLLAAPLKHREIIHEPLLGAMDISAYLASGKISRVTCGGESGENARVCDYAWVLALREQCMEAKVPFYFKQTGAKFMKEGKLYCIPRRLQMRQAQKAGLNT